jgi:MFS family permease
MPATDQRISNVRNIPNEVGALLSALQLGQPDPGPLAKLSKEQWVSLIAFCDIAHLTLPLAQLAAPDFPQWIRERLSTNLKDNAQRFEKLREAYCEVHDALCQAGIEFVVIKGFTHAPDYVASPRLRAQWDIDIVCLPEQIDRAQVALEEIGYYASQQKRDKRADHVPSLSRQSNWTWNGNLFDPDLPLGIELHFCLWNESSMRFPIEVGDFWNRRTVRIVEGLTFPVLNPVDHLGYLALHILRNILNNDWIIHLVRELAVFLHAHSDDDLFWTEWAELHDPQLRSFEAIAFYYARAWFGCSLHPQVEEAISGLRPIQLHLLSRISVTGLQNMFRQNKDSIWLHLTLLSSMQTKGGMLVKTLIPSSVSSISSPAVLTRNKRRIQPKSNSRWLQYISYLIARSGSHLQSNGTTVARGFTWWCSQSGLSSQYWTFLAASFFFDLGLSIYFFLFNLFLVGRGYTEKNLGIFTGAIAIGNLVGALPAGNLVRRVGLRPVVLSCFTLAIAFSSLRAVLLSFPAQVVLAFLEGVTLSAWAVCLPLSVAQVTTEKQRPVAFSLLFSLGIGLGAVGGLAGSRLPGVITNIHPQNRGLDPGQLVLLFSCALIGLGIWPATRLRFTRPQVTEKSRPLLSPFLLRYLPAIAVWSLVTGSFSPLASVYLAKHVHLSLQQIGNAFATSQIVQVGAVLLAPVLFRKWGLINSIVFTQIAAACLLLIMAFTSQPIAAAAAYVCFSAFQWMNEPGLYSLLMNMVPAEDRSGASASNSLVTSGVNATAATLAGSAFLRYGYPAVLRGIALMAVLAASLFRNLQERRLPKSSPVLDDISG